MKPKTSHSFYEFLKFEATSFNLLSREPTTYSLAIFLRVLIHLMSNCIRTGFIICVIIPLSSDVDDDGDGDVQHI